MAPFYLHKAHKSNSCNLVLEPWLALRLRLLLHRLPMHAAKCIFVLLMARYLFYSRWSAAFVYDDGWKSPHGQGVVMKFDLLCEVVAAAWKHSDTTEQQQQQQNEKKEKHKSCQEHENAHSSNPLINLSPPPSSHPQSGCELNRAQKRREPPSLSHSPGFIFGSCTLEGQSEAQALQNELAHDSSSKPSHKGYRILNSSYLELLTVVGDINHRDPSAVVLFHMRSVKPHPALWWQRTQVNFKVL